MIFLYHVCFLGGSQKVCTNLTSFCVYYIFFFFFNQTSRKTAQINCQLHKKIITMFRCKLNSGLCFSSEVLLAGAGEGGTYVRSLNFKHYRFMFWIIGLVLVGVQPILMPFVAISSSFMLLLQGHVNCRNFTLSHAWFLGALLLLLGNILVFFTKILCWVPWVWQF